VELAHGYAANLLAKKPDFLFLPHLGGIHNPADTGIACTCVFVQGEPFYLPAAFSGFNGNGTLRPYLDFSKGIDGNMNAFREVVTRLGVDARKTEMAARAAWAEQESFWSDLSEMGKEALAKVGEDPEAIGVVLFGRPYNSFAPEANKGAPAKFASRGVRIIPFDMMPCAGEQLPKDRNMYWGIGRQILKAAQYVKKNPQLFAAYITNFSCGPDSFLVGYFRDIMGRKPSLTLELDSHTADAGVETRIEAFLDIVHFYRRAGEERPTTRRTNGFRPAVVEFHHGRGGIRTSSNEWVPLEDKRVKVIIPAMGRYGTPLMAKALARRGVRAEVLPPADEEVLKLGRGNSSCKECLPLQTTIGSLLHYLRQRPEGEITAYFMASTDGPCRFGQYHVFSKDLLEKQEIPNVAVLSLTTENGYAGLGDRFAVAAWRGMIIGDLFDEMYSTILAGAVDPQEGLAVLEHQHQALLEVIHRGWPAVARQLARTAKKLAQIPLKKPYPEIPKLSLTGEIYVRRDPISLQGLVERLARHGFIVRTSQTSEWIKYLDWLAREGIDGENSVSFWVRYWVKRYFDRRVRQKLAPSGLFFFEDAEVEPVVKAGSRFVSPRLMGEAILTVGSAFHEILHPSCGIISIGPFGCMPSRLAESILSEKLTMAEKRVIAAHNGHAAWDAAMETNRKLPFLAIETDGNAFPQVIEARLEAFMLQAQRVHDILLKQTGRDPA
jgi:predicted nucleotide-binding protein (sugar kinase/HSP70/actin superfamily)